MEHNIETVGNTLGGAVGSGIQTGVNAYNTYHDITQGNYTQAMIDGANTIISGVDTIKDAESGDWIN